MSFNKVMLRELKASIFLDHRNIYAHIQKKKEFKGYVIDYNKLRKIVLQNFTPAGAFAFLGVNDPLLHEKGLFLDHLEQSGFTPLLRKLVERSDGTFVQKGVDILMGLQIDNLMPAFDVAILITGDADFTVIVELLKNSNKYVHIWSWKGSMSPVLLKEAGKDNIFYIDSIWDKIKRKRKRNDPSLKF